MVTYEQVRENPNIRTYIQRADESLIALGYTEHSFAHVTVVAETAAYILKTLDYPDRTVELAKIAGFLHDIGNLVNRVEHFRLLEEMGCDTGEIATIVTAIGNHDEGTGQPVNPVAAALILADKADVRRSRVRNQDKTTFDIHDRVNYSVERAKLSVSDDRTAITLSLTVDAEYAAVMEYFEIFLQRMIMCRKAAAALGLEFHLTVNGQQMV